jgi:hypothetical protein
MCSGTKFLYSKLQLSYANKVSSKQSIALQRKQPDGVQSRLHDNHCRNNIRAVMQVTHIGATK